MTQYNTTRKFWHSSEYRSQISYSNVSL